MYFHVNLNFPKFNKSAFVGEWTIYRFHNARSNDKSGLYILAILNIWIWVTENYRLITVHSIIYEHNFIKESRRRGITQKKEHNIQNTAKVRNQEFVKETSQRQTKTLHAPILKTFLSDQYRAESNKPRIYSPFLVTSLRSAISSVECLTRNIKNVEQSCMHDSPQLFAILPYILSWYITWPSLHKTQILVLKQ